MYSSIQKIFVLGALLLSLFPVASRAVPLQEISEIKVEGNKKIDKSAILSKISSKVGETISDKKISEDIKSIYSLGFFQYIEAKKEDVSEGKIKLIFKVEERPTISNLVFKGLEAFSKDEIRDQILVKQYEVLDISKLNESIQRLSDKYEEKGFFLVDMHYELKLDEKNNEVEVTFVIRENAKVQVKSISLVGNHQVSSEELKNVMQTKEGDFLSFLTGSGTYRETILERDIALLTYYYGTLGYVKIKFGKPQVSVSPDKKHIYIALVIDEGERYRIGKIDFMGDLLFAKEDLMQDLSLISGDYFNTDILRKETLRYTDKYSDLGYAFCNVIPQFNIHDDTKTVDILFEVDKGQRVYIGKIFFTGNTKTKDKVIRRELLINEGELYSGTKKNQSRENVVRLGYFDSVDFEQKPSKTDPHILDIEVKVKERSTSQLMITAGYASGNVGFTAQAQLSQTNFMGNGQIANLSAQVLTGQNFYEFNLGFTEPYIGPTLWSGGGDLYQLQRNLYTIPTITTFHEVKTGFDMKFGHPVFKFTNLVITYKLENSYVDPATIIDRSLIPPYTVNGILSSLSLTMSFDKRNDRLDPREGWFLSLSSEFAGLGGTRDFIRNRIQYKFFHPIVWDFVYRMNIAGTTIGNVGNNPVPINELEILGGLFTLRGYNFLSIGPRGTISSNTSYLSQAAINAGIMGQSIVIGGQNSALLQSEIEFPILKEAKIRGVIFFDAGNAFDGSIFNQNPMIYANFGYGFRWFTPLGPLRFEFGYPIVNPGPPKFYFTIGPPF